MTLLASWPSYESTQRYDRIRHADKQNDLETF